MENDIFIRFAVIKEEVKSLFGEFGTVN